MDGHKWCQVCESEVTTTYRSHSTTRSVVKKQWLWLCSRCGQSTIIDEGQDPESMKALYGIEPLELDGTTIIDPPIGTCDEEFVGSVFRS